MQNTSLHSVRTTTITLPELSNVNSTVTEFFSEHSTVHQQEPRLLEADEANQKLAAQNLGELNGTLRAELQIKPLKKLNQTQKTGISTFLKTPVEIKTEVDGEVFSFDFAIAPIAIIRHLYDYAKKNHKMDKISIRLIGSALIHFLGFDYFKENFASQDIDIEKFFSADYLEILKKEISRRPNDFDLSFYIEEATADIIEDLQQELIKFIFSKCPELPDHKKKKGLLLLKKKYEIEKRQDKYPHLQQNSPGLMSILFKELAFEKIFKFKPNAPIPFTLTTIQNCSQTSVEFFIAQKPLSKTHSLHKSLMLDLDLEEDPNLEEFNHAPRNEERNGFQALWDYMAKLYRPHSQSINPEELMLSTLIEGFRSPEPGQEDLLTQKLFQKAKDSETSVPEYLAALIIKRIKNHHKIDAPHAALLMTFLTCRLMQTVLTDNDKKHLVSLLRDRWEKADFKPGSFWKCLSNIMCDESTNWELVIAFFQLIPFLNPLCPSVRSAHHKNQKAYVIEVAGQEKTFSILLDHKGQDSLLFFLNNCDKLIPANQENFKQIFLSYMSTHLCSYLGSPIQSVVTACLNCTSPLSKLVATYTLLSFSSLENFPQALEMVLASLPQILLLIENDDLKEGLIKKIEDHLIQKPWAAELSAPFKELLQALKKQKPQLADLQQIWILALVQSPHTTFQKLAVKIWQKDQHLSETQITDVGIALFDALIRIDLVIPLSILSSLQKKGSLSFKEHLTLFHKAYQAFCLLPQPQQTVQASMLKQRMPLSDDLQVFVAEAMKLGCINEAKSLLIFAKNFLQIDKHTIGLAWLSICELTSNAEEAEKAWKEGKGHQILDTEQKKYWDVFLKLYQSGKFHEELDLTQIPQSHRELFHAHYRLQLEMLPPAQILKDLKEGQGQHLVETQKHLLFDKLLKLEYLDLLTKEAGPMLETIVSYGIQQKVHEQPNLKPEHKQRFSEFLCQATLSSHPTEAFQLLPGIPVNQQIVMLHRICQLYPTPSDATPFFSKIREAVDQLFNNRKKITALKPENEICKSNAFLCIFNTLLQNNEHQKAYDFALLCSQKHLISEDAVAQIWYQLCETYLKDPKLGLLEAEKVWKEGKKENIFKPEQEGYFTLALAIWKGMIAANPKSQEKFLQEANLSHIPPNQKPDWEGLYFDCLKQQITANPNMVLQNLEKGQGCALSSENKKTLYQEILMLKLSQNKNQDVLAILGKEPALLEPLLAKLSKELNADTLNSTIAILHLMTFKISNLKQLLASNGVASICMQCFSLAKAKGYIHCPNLALLAEIGLEYLLEDSSCTIDLAQAVLTLIENRKLLNQTFHGVFLNKQPPLFSELQKQKQYKILCSFLKEFNSIDTSSENMEILFHILNDSLDAAPIDEMPVETTYQFFSQFPHRHHWSPTQLKALYHKFMKVLSLHQHHEQVLECFKQNALPLQDSDPLTFANFYATITHFHSHNKHETVLQALEALQLLGKSHIPPMTEFDQLICTLLQPMEGTSGAEMLDAIQQLPHLEKHQTMLTNAGQKLLKTLASSSDVASLRKAWEYVELYPATDPDTYQKLYENTLALKDRQARSLKEKMYPYLQKIPGEAQRTLPSAWICTIKALTELKSPILIEILQNPQKIDSVFSDNGFRSTFDCHLMMGCAQIVEKVVKAENQKGIIDAIFLLHDKQTSFLKDSTNTDLQQATDWALVIHLGKIGNAQHLVKICDILKTLLPEPGGFIIFEAPVNNEKDLFEKVSKLLIQNCTSNSNISEEEPIQLIKENDNQNDGFNISPKTKEALTNILNNVQKWTDIPQNIMYNQMGFLAKVARWHCPTPPILEEFLYFFMKNPIQKFYFEAEITLLCYLPHLRIQAHTVDPNRLDKFKTYVESLVVGLIYNKMTGCTNSNNEMRLNNGKRCLAFKGLSSFIPLQTILNYSFDILFQDKSLDLEDRKKLIEFFLQYLEEHPNAYGLPCLETGFAFLLGHSLEQKNVSSLSVWMSRVIEIVKGNAAKNISYNKKSNTASTDLDVTPIFKFIKTILNTLPIYKGDPQENSKIEILEFLNHHILNFLNAPTLFKNVENILMQYSYSILAMSLSCKDEAQSDFLKKYVSLVNQAYKMGFFLDRTTAGIELNLLFWPILQKNLVPILTPTKTEDHAKKVCEVLERLSKSPARERLNHILAVAEVCHESLLNCDPLYLEIIFDTLIQMLNRVNYVDINFLYQCLRDQLDELLVRSIKAHNPNHELIKKLFLMNRKLLLCVAQLQLPAPDKFLTEEELFKINESNREMASDQYYSKIRPALMPADFPQFMRRFFNLTLQSIKYHKAASAKGRSVNELLDAYIADLKSMNLNFEPTAQLERAEVCTDIVATIATISSDPIWLGHAKYFLKKVIQERFYEENPLSKKAQATAIKCLAQIEESGSPINTDNNNKLQQSPLPVITSNSNSSKVQSTKQTIKDRFYGLLTSLSKSDQDPLEQPAAIGALDDLFIYMSKLSLQHDQPEFLQRAQACTEIIEIVANISSDPFWMEVAQNFFKKAIKMGFYQGGGEVEILKRKAEIAVSSANDY